MPDMNAGILEEIEDQNLSAAASGDDPPFVSVITICGPTISLIDPCATISFATVVTCGTCQ
ncbi:hypothetical protein ACFXKD_25770 [Nocardiopsis aegyptia]|uniref:hypothetical protein n=1 Tax=Nocardiopsis aegyptia TaxID=220378 RepID=UPI00366ABF2D